MKRFVSLILAICMLSMPLAIFAEDSVPIGVIGGGSVKYMLQGGIFTTIDTYPEGMGVEVGDQFLVDFVTSAPGFLTAGIYGTFDNSIATIVAPVYSNSRFGILTNQFDNEEGTFKIEGYDNQISGIEEEVVVSILFEAVAPGEFTIDLSDDCLLGKINENGFYDLEVCDFKLIIFEDTDGSDKMIIEEPKPLTPFEDMLGYDWAEKAVGVMYELGVLENIADTSYNPGVNITRGEFITMLMRVCKQKKDTDIENFSDVSLESYQYEHILTAKSMGIALGYDNNFRPDEYITREEICALVFRTMLKMNKARSEIIPEDYIGKFSDKEQISEYAKNSVAGLIRAKLIIGDDNGLIRPKDNMTRAEAAVLLNRLAEYNILISM
ncbi:MAG: S-layer homology domain-containing protein [Clostridia bacterium]